MEEWSPYVGGHRGMGSLHWWSDVEGPSTLVDRWRWAPYTGGQREKGPTMVDRWRKAGYIGGQAEKYP